MPPQSAEQNYGDAMRKVLSQIAVIGALPDADMDFVTQLQQAITQNLRDKAQQQTQAMQQGAQQAGAAGGFPGPGGAQGMPAGPPGMGGGPPGMGGGAAGPMQGLVPSAPNMDEIRRALAAGGTAQ